MSYVCQYCVSNILMSVPSALIWLTKTDLAAVFNESGFQPWKMIKMENHFRKRPSGPPLWPEAVNIHVGGHTVITVLVIYVFWYYCSVSDLISESLCFNNEHQKQNTGSLDSFFSVGCEEFWKNFIALQTLPPDPETPAVYQLTSDQICTQTMFNSLFIFNIYYSSKSAAERIKAFKHVMNDRFFNPSNDSNHGSVWTLCFKHMKLY